MESTVEARIADWLDEKLKEPEFADCFLIDIHYSEKANKLEVFLDSDTGITFDKCRQISRHLENLLDTDQMLGDSYTLEVSSAGVGRPLKLPRQYLKNVGREVEIILTSGTTKIGKLVEATDFAATLEELVVTQEGKKKKKELVQTIIPYDDMKKTTVKISF
jgi:ribosome maturation factor RimP